MEPLLRVCRDKRPALYINLSSRRSRAFLSFRTLLAFLGWLILVYAAPHECFMKLPEAAAPFPSRDSGVFG